MTIARDSRVAPVWAGLSAEQHEFQYNPQRAFPDFARHGAERASLNAETKRLWPPDLDVRYGDHDLRTLDIYRAPAGQKRCPAHLFLHGGYWRAQDKQNFAFIASALVPLGITTIVANYELCPESTLDGVVDSALAAFEWTCRHVGDYGADPRRISISGHSAGAHLAAAILATDWPSRGIDASVLTGATLVSGIFDPTPAMRTTVNDKLNLDVELAQRHNLERMPLHVKCPVALIAGGREPEQWVDQSFRYYHQLRRHGMRSELHVLANHDHFDILSDFTHPEGTTRTVIRRQAG